MASYSRQTPELQEAEPQQAEAVVAPAAERGESAAERASVPEPGSYQDMEQFLARTDIGAADVLSKAAEVVRIRWETADQVLGDPGMRGRLQSLLDPDSFAMLLVYWQTGADYSMHWTYDAVKWLHGAGGVTASAWGRFIAGKTAEQCRHIVENPEALAIAKNSLEGIPTSLFPELERDPFQLKDCMELAPLFKEWIVDVGGVELLHQIEGEIATAEEAKRRRSEMVASGTWSGYLAGLPNRMESDPEQQQRLYYYLLCEDQVSRQVLLYKKRFGIDLVPKGEPSSKWMVNVGETLWGIANAVFGSGERWAELYEFGSNRRTIGGDPHRLEAGTELEIPTDSPLAWDSRSIIRTWTISAMLPPADVASTIKIIREGISGDATGWASDDGSMGMSWGTDTMDSTEVGTYTADEDPMRGLNIYDATLRHEIGHHVGATTGLEGVDSWTGEFGWEQYYGTRALTEVFRVFHSAHPLDLSGLGISNEDRTREKVFKALAKLSSWEESTVAAAVNGVRAGLFEDVVGTAFFGFFFDRIEGWEDPVFIGGKSYHAPYEDWGVFQSAPAEVYAKKVSTYAMRSSMEWFAEIYATFYSDADRPGVPPGTLLESRDPAAAAGFREEVDGRHTLAAITGQVEGECAP